MLNKNIKMSSFKSSENIQKKAVGPNVFRLKATEDKTCHTNIHSINLIRIVFATMHSTEEILESNHIKRKNGT